MSARRFALLAALAFGLAFIAANVVANSWFRSWRIDLTQNQLYSLSRGTQQTLNDLSEPVQLTLYFSRDAATVAPQVQVYAARVREMLQSYQARSRGRVRFVEVNVEPFSEAEDEAVEAGIQPVRPFEGADPIYFGLTGANAIDDTRAIPFLAQQREAFLEYELTRLIYELEHPERTRVGLITSLPIDPGAPAGFSTSQQSHFSTELGQFFEVETLPANFTDIPDVDVLAIIHPGALSPVQLYAIDQFILRNGRAFIALDPAAYTAQQTGGFDPFNPVAPAPTSSNLGPLLEHWGVQMTPGVVLDGEGALPIQTQDETGQPVTLPQPLLFSVPADHLDRADMATAFLTRGVNFALAGGLSWSEREGVTITPLARTSGETMRMTAAEAMMLPPPIQVLRMWQQSGGRIETVALRLNGPLQTAFPQGRPADEPQAEPEAVEPPPAQTPAPAQAAPPETAPALTQSATPAQLIIVSDVDFLADQFFMDRQANVPAVDNASFALNAIDVLAGSDALISLRSRAPAERRMDRVDEMERDAQRRIQARQDELEGEMQETQMRLAELQSRGRGSGFFAGDLGAEMTAEENAEIERFRARLIEVRGELRSVERDLRSDIDALETLIVFVNVWLAPMLVAGGGLFFFWRRQRRARAGGRR